MILSIDGKDEAKDIREFVDTYFLAQDSRSLRNYIKDFQPDVNLNIPIELQGGEENITIPIGLTFFWPDADL